MPIFCVVLEFKKGIEMQFRCNITYVKLTFLAINSSIMTSVLKRIEHVQPTYSVIHYALVLYIFKNALFYVLQYLLCILNLNNLSLCSPFTLYSHHVHVQSQ